MSAGRWSSCQRRTASASASTRVARHALRRLGACRLDAVEAQRPLADGCVAAVAHVLDDRPRRSLIASIRSTGTSRIDDPPAASSRGSSRQTSAAGTSACTATMPGSASGSDARRARAGDERADLLERALGRVQHEVAGLARLDDAAQHASRARARARRRRACPMSTASDEKSAPSERRPFVLQRAPARDEIDDRVGEPEARSDLDRARDLDQLDRDSALAQERPATGCSRRRRRSASAAPTMSRL